MCLLLSHSKEKKPILHVPGTKEGSQANILEGKLSTYKDDFPSNFNSNTRALSNPSSYS